MTAQMTAQQMQQAAMQVNAARRAWIFNNAVQMFQPVATQALPNASVIGSVNNVQLRNVGLVRRLLIEISGTVAQGAAETQTMTKLGLSNILSNVTLTDLSNQTRINTTGWHLHMVASAKRKQPFGAAYVTDSPVGFGSNLQIMNGAQSVTAAKTFRWVYEVPCEVMPGDMRGAIYANVVNATFQLQYTVNPNFFVASTTDETPAVYKSSTAQLGALTGVTVVVYQDYYDQIPNAQDGKPMLPAMDISTAYLLNQTSLTGLATAQDFPVTYANNREFLSTCVIYDNAALNAGTDITGFKLQVANYTNILQYNDPFMQSLATRNIMGEDFPIGAYYFDHRQRPIETINYGNQQLIVTPSTVQANAQLLVGFESTAIINQLINAGSLPSG